MFDYDSASKRASKIIKKWGSSGSLVKEGQKGGYDSEGNETPDVPDVIIVGTITPIINYKSHEVDGDLIINGDGWCLFDSEEEPQIGMITTVGSKTWRLEEIRPLESPTGIVIRNLLHLRK